ncbi:ABC transporter permease [Herbiconiux sp. KACC 21604]|uniref:ABC transporter permease n=1 Tax=unclassified Herbiconiux TaxID=2618217 RepID=UPI0014930BEB|nr:ABC transporter permease [Herbiconiux sp. SALV-R1]QJU54151.1 ABC transporter permease [Herbiconiux sp. SALV-R1]WPO85204.1 ABC transporter permease [Herbiconiux sp. KACC 21604]
MAVTDRTPGSPATAPTTAPSAASRAAGRRDRPRHGRSILVSIAYFIIPLAVLVALWQIATALWPSPFFPQPSAIGQNLLRLLFGGEQLATPVFTGDFLTTVGRMLAGYAIGAAWGVVVGTAMGLSRASRETVTPIVEFLRSIPATATLPLFIILLGGGDDMRVIFIAYGVSWFVLINTAAGVGSIHRTMLDLGKVFKISPVRRLFSIVLPAASPKIFAGLRIASTAALLLAIVSEFILATNGIGFQLIQAQGRFQLLDMWSWMLALALLGLLLNSLLDLVEGRVLSWHRLSRQKI